jgi:phosphoribosylcarboxyaminoimidazole (NCAIR) mutase
MKSLKGSRFHVSVSYSICLIFKYILLVSHTRDEPAQSRIARQLHIRSPHHQDLYRGPSSGRLNQPIIPLNKGSISMLRRLTLHRNIRGKHSLRFTMASLELKGFSSRTHSIDVIPGQYEPTNLSKVVYGRGSIQRLPELLASLNAKKAFVVTGSSLQNKTPVIKEIEAILGDKHVKTFSKISQHAPIQAIREAAEEAKKGEVDVFISVGGGSPIDSTKGALVSSTASLIIAIIHSLQQESGGEFLPHIAVPTTLSVAGTFSTWFSFLRRNHCKLGIHVRRGAQNWYSTSFGVSTNDYI